MAKLRTDVTGSCTLVDPTCLANTCTCSSCPAAANSTGAVLVEVPAIYCKRGLSECSGFSYTSSLCSNCTDKAWTYYFVNGLFTSVAVTNPYDGRCFIQLAMQEKPVPMPGSAARILC